MSNERHSERELFQSALQRTRECPPIEALERILDGADPQAASHAESCGFCSAELQMLRSFRLADVSPEDAQAVELITQRLDQQPLPLPRRVEEHRKAWWRFDGSWLRSAALAAAGILVVIAIGLQLHHAGPPALRTSGGAEVFRSQALTVLSPSGDLSKSPEEVIWQAVPSAMTYQVRLLEVDGNELWTARTAGASIAFPPEVRAHIVPAKTLFAEVTAFDSEGRKIAQSEKMRFRILQTIYPR